MRKKIEGTNVYCFWNGHDRIFYGKTENAEIPLHLLAKMEVLFPIEKLKEVFPLKYDEQGLEMPFEARIYGEGYGIKIKKGQQ